QDRDALVLRLHLLEVALLVRLPVNRRLAVLAVERGVQLLAGAELTPPQVPRLFLLGQGARAVAADQQAEAVVRLARRVPRFRLDVSHDTPFAVRCKATLATQPRRPSLLYSVRGTSMDRLALLLACVCLFCFPAVVLAEGKRPMKVED